MVLRPTYPKPDTYTPTPLPPHPVAPVVPATEHHAAACTCHHTPAPITPTPAAARATVQLTPGSTLALVAGGAGIVLVLGAVLVSMLLAVAITATSVAVCAVVLRSLLTHQHRDH